jgi:hypothetical protein
MYDKISLTLVVFLSYFGATAQTFQGMAVYESKIVQLILKQNGGNRNITPEKKTWKKDESNV